MQDTLLAPLAVPAARLSAPSRMPSLPREQSWQAREAALVLDNEGRVTDANEAAATLLGYHAAALEGLAVNQLIPDLPLSITTPGYNLAYAAFHAAATHWPAHTALTAKGDFLPIELTFACVRVHGIRVIALTLRPRADAARHLS